MNKRQKKKKMQRRRICILGCNKGPNCEPIGIKSHDQFLKEYGYAKPDELLSSMFRGWLHDSGMPDSDMSCTKPSVKNNSCLCTEKENVITTHTQYKDGNTMRFDNVPATQCKHCNEIYFSEEVLDRIERAE